MASKTKTVLVIPDTQFPFHHKDTFPFLEAVTKKYQPNEFVHLGDEVDFHALSNFDADPDGFSAGHELVEALKYMRVLYKMYPKMKVCTSNHTARPFRRAHKHGIPKAFLRDYHEFLEAPKGWTWADQWEIDGVLYEHGEGQSGALGALKAALGNMQSTVIGHLHSFAGISWSANPRHLVFGFNGGCVSAETEYFNGNTWVPISEYKEGDNVLQWEKSGKATLVQPLEYIKIPAKTLNKLYNSYGLYQEICDQHRVVYKNTAGAILEREFSDIKERHALHPQGFQGRILPHFEYSGAGVDLSEGAIRLQVAVLADGTLHGNRCVIQLKKQRKKDRLEMLLVETGTDYSKSDYENGITRFSFVPPVFSKEIPEWWYKMSSSQLSTIREECMLWDGDFKKRNRFSSTRKSHIDFYQFAYAAAGFRTSITWDKPNGKNTIHLLMISLTKKHNNLAGNVNSPLAPKAVIEEIETTDGFKYCFKTPSSYLILRCKGSIFVTGNCLIDHKAYAFAYGKHMKNKPIIGAGIVHRGIPLYLPMQLSTRGRWTGEV